METVVKLDKYDLRRVQFAKNDVLIFPQKMEERAHEIQRGLIAGNTHKTPVRIIFEGDGQLMEIEATIWAVTESWVILKSDLMIPIRCIHEVIV